LAAATLIGLALMSSGCRCGELFGLGAPTAYVRLEYELDRSLSPQPRAAEIDTAMQKSRDVVSRRLEEFHVRGAAVTIVETKLIVDIPIRGDDVEELWSIRRALSRQGLLEFKIVDDQERDFYLRLRPFVEQDVAVELVTEQQTFSLEAPDQRLPDGKIRDGREAIQNLLDRAREQGIEVAKNRELLFGNTIQLAGAGQKVWRSYYVHRETALTGDTIADAQVAFDDANREPFVSITFNEEGRRAFSEVTAANTKKRLAIVLDREVDSAPVIQEPIRGGQARISLGSGVNPNELLAEAQELAVTLRSGALPAKLTLLSETTISPPSE